MGRGKYSLHSSVIALHPCRTLLPNAASLAHCLGLLLPPWTSQQVFRGILPQQSGCVCSHCCSNTVLASYFPQSRKGNTWNLAKRFLHWHVTVLLEQQGKYLHFLRIWLFSFSLVRFLLNSCPFTINTLSLEDPFWWHIEFWQILTLEQPSGTRINLVLRSGGKWLSLKLKLSKCHLGKDSVWISWNWITWTLGYHYRCCTYFSLGWWENMLTLEDKVFP